MPSTKITNNIKPHIDTPTSDRVLDDPSYNSNEERIKGYVPNSVIHSKNVNTGLRQATLFASSMVAAIVNNLVTGYDITEPITIGSMTTKEALDIALTEALDQMVKGKITGKQDVIKTSSSVQTIVTVNNMGTANSGKEIVNVDSTATRQNKIPTLNVTHIIADKSLVDAKAYTDILATRVTTIEDDNKARSNEPNMAVVATPFGPKKSNISLPFTKLKPDQWWEYTIPSYSRDFPRNLTKILIVTREGFSSGPALPAKVKLMLDLTESENSITVDLDLSSTLLYVLSITLDWSISASSDIYNTHVTIKDILTGEILQGDYDVLEKSTLSQGEVFGIKYTTVNSSNGDKFSVIGLV